MPIVLLLLWCNSITSVFYPAIYDADYTLESTSVRFARGQNQSYNNMQCKNITVLDDSILEYNESFTLSIVAAHPAITGAINKTKVLIMEDPSDCKFVSHVIRM